MGWSEFLSTPDLHIAQMVVHWKLPFGPAKRYLSPQVGLHFDALREGDALRFVLVGGLPDSAFSVCMA
jgi:hypothetical protein